MSGLLHFEIMYYCQTYYMQQFSTVYNNLFVFPEPVDEPRPTYSGGGPIHARGYQFRPTLNFLEDREYVYHIIDNHQMDHLHL